MNLFPEVFVSIEVFHLFYRIWLEAWKTPLFG